MGAIIASAASTKYDKRPESSSRELFGEAAVEAFEGTCLSPGDLDTVYVGNFMGDLIEDHSYSV